MSQKSASRSVTLSKEGTDSRHVRVPSRRHPTSMQPPSTETITHHPPILSMGVGEAFKPTRGLICGFQWLSSLDKIVIERMTGPLSSLSSILLLHRLFHFLYLYEALEYRIVRVFQSRHPQVGSPLLKAFNPSFTLMRACNFIPWCCARCKERTQLMYTRFGSTTAGVKRRNFDRWRPS